MSLVSPAINFPFLPSIMLIINLVKKKNKSAYDSGPTYCLLTVKSHLLFLHHSENSGSQPDVTGDSFSVVASLVLQMTLHTWKVFHAHLHVLTDPNLITSSSRSIMAIRLAPHSLPPSPGESSPPGWNTASPTLQEDSLPSELPGEPSSLCVLYALLLVLHHYSCDILLILFDKLFDSRLYPPCVFSLSIPDLSIAPRHSTGTEYLLNK